MSSAGNVLLKPDCGCPGPHTVGAIDAPEVVEAGAPLEASVSFGYGNTKAGHNVAWTWGDGSGVQQGNAREGKGVGKAAASHRYTAPGIYTVSVKVGDRSGEGPTVSRTVVVTDKSAGDVGGSGWFTSSLGAKRTSAGQRERAVFGFYVPGASGAQPTAARASLRFNVGSLGFRSEGMRPVAAQGARRQFEGRGTLNGVGAYSFRLSTTAVQGQPGRFGLKIWHVDPVTRAQVVDYDNLGAGTGSAVPAAQGKIVLQ